MSSSILLDTSVCIDLLREGNWQALQLNTERSLYFSSVVLQELYSGAKDKFTQKGLHNIRQVFSKNGLLLTPNENDWIECGKIICALGNCYGFETVARSRLVNDVLIALTAFSIDATLMTTNKKDFARIAEFCSFNWCEPSFF